MEISTHIQVCTDDQFTVNATQRLGFPFVTIDGGKADISFPDVDTLVRFRDTIHCWIEEQALTTLPMPDGTWPVPSTEELVTLGLAAPVIGIAASAEPHECVCPSRKPCREQRDSETGECLMCYACPQCAAVAESDF